LAFVIIGGQSVIAQFGASPSQTGLFFNDLNMRTKERDKQAGVRSGEAIYDYGSGVYLSNANDERAMGEEAAFASNEAMREMGQPALRSGYAGYSTRSAGDYTRYSGPYPATSSFFAPTYISDPFLGGRRNLKVGPVNVGFGLSGLVEYNDNVARSSTDEVSDIIASGFLSIDANYQITRNNALSITTTLGFDHYFDHPELSPYGGDFVLNVLPGSTIAFDIKAGPVNITLYDRISVRPAVRNDFDLDPTNFFGVFQNDAGIAASWAVNADTNLSLNYTRSDAISMEEIDKIYDRTMNTVAGSLSWSPEHTWTVGLEGSGSFVTYPEHYNNDGTLVNAGAFFSTPLGRSTFVRVSGGIQEYNFDAPSASPTKPSNGDYSDLSDYYYNATLTNQLSARISQSLSFGHESALNTTTNFVTANYVTYGIGIIAWRGSRLSISGYYEDSDESGGLEQEDLTQKGIDVYLSHQLSSRARIGVGYHYGVTDSDLPLRDYVQQAFNIDLSYALSRKFSVALGYRFWTTDADDATNDFDQNRVVMQMNYNFGP